MLKWFSRPIHCFLFKNGKRGKPPFWGETPLIPKFKMALHLKRNIMVSRMIVETFMHLSQFASEIRPSPLLPSSIFFLSPPPPFLYVYIIYSRRGVFTSTISFICYFNEKLVVSRLLMVN